MHCGCPELTEDWIRKWKSQVPFHARFGEGFTLSTFGLCPICFQSGQNEPARRLLTCDADSQALPQFHRLTTLDLYGDTWECLPLQAEDLSHLASLTGLQHLGLHHFEISGSLKSFSQGEHA